MSVSTWFKTFNTNLRIPTTTVSNIRARYKQITKRINIDYWSSYSETSHSLYVGSYGRGTDIVVSDIDILAQLPYETYLKFKAYDSNGQSALLQEVRNVIARTYSTTRLRGDGQVVVVKFTDGVIFEIVPAFINDDDSYTYPDTNNGGSWKITNPKPEIDEINRANNEWNKNLKRLCHMARAWKYKWDVPIGGLLIDTLAYNFLRDWKYNDKSYAYYDWMSRDFFEFLKNQNEDQEYWLSPGARQRVWRKGKFEYKAKRCYNISLEAIKSEGNTHHYTAKSKWREIYGIKFPS